MILPRIFFKSEKSADFFSSKTFSFLPRLSAVAENGRKALSEITWENHLDISRHGRFAPIDSVYSENLKVIPRLNQPCSVLPLLIFSI